MTKPEHVSDAMQRFADRYGYGHYFFFGMQANEKWLMTCSHGFSKEKMKALRDYFDNQLKSAARDAPADVGER